METFVHLGESFPQTIEQYENCEDLNQGEFRHRLLPSKALYFCREGVRSYDNKYESPWIRYCVKNCLYKLKYGPDYEKSRIVLNKYTVTFKEHTRIFHIRCVGDLNKFKEMYFRETPYTEFPNYLTKFQEFSNTLEKLQEEFDAEMKTILDESAETEGDVYFKCSKTVTVKLYDRQLNEIVFEPQKATIHRKAGDKKIPLKIPRVCELDTEINKTINLWEDYMERQVMDRVWQYQRIDYNQMRQDGYHGIEIHPEIVNWIHRHENKHFEDEHALLRFIKWLSFPQLIVINWCIDTVQVKPFDIRDHYLESDKDKLDEFNSWDDDD